MIRRRVPRRTLDAVELVTVEWVRWFAARRLLEPIGNVPPAQAEESFFARQADEAMAG